MTNYYKIVSHLCFADSESPAMSVSGATQLPLSPDHHGEHDLPNEISAPYEVPQFPIEQIEKKLIMQRQLNAK